MIDSKYISLVRFRIDNYNDEFPLLSRITVMDRWVGPCIAKVIDRRLIDKYNTKFWFDLTFSWDIRVYTYTNLNDQSKI